MCKIFLWIIVGIVLMDGIGMTIGLLTFLIAQSHRNAQNGLAI
jgi:hypothetical protein